ncbi:MAG TPA: DUF87 domain-containing protein [Thermoanaerobaculia bacterium]|nr:DUF87 domain-containing protein [Thermoanaerobaculia bacterium]
MSATFSPSDFERLGVFYLGREVDAKTGDVGDTPFLYDSSDLTTHALIVGMTGSGKTGLGLCMIEEAAIDGIPAIVIDPKGDMGNLLLAFPDLRPDDFVPWVDPQEAARAGRTVAEHASEVAQTWREGLAEWGQDGARVARMRSSADFHLYTPGSNAGLPLSLLRSFDPPPAVVRDDGDALRERIQLAVQGLLALVGIAADPLQSHEHVLLANLFDRAWREGRGLDLPQLVREVLKPPFEQLGVIDLETFYPARERSALAMALNALLASPGFQVWLEGEALDPGRLLFGPDGKPRISVISIAHLSDAERMFVVTTLLGAVVSWMRAQTGTTSLRAMLYMDEIFGFFPPTAMPPSKPAMLSLLKQARAYGLGVVLATQNPVDLDYKGLSNCGTWFLGRLQTARDKGRVIDGLESAAAGAEEKLGGRAAVDALLSGLGKRTFVVHNVHEDGPVLLRTRWALSYLRGPMGRDEIARLVAAQKGALTPAPVSGAAVAPAVAAAPTSAEVAGSVLAAAAEPPLAPEGIEESFVDVAAGSGVAAAGASSIVYRPYLLGSAQLHFSRRGVVDRFDEVTLLAPIEPAARKLAWDDAIAYEGAGPVTRTRPVEGATRFGELAAAARRKPSYESARKTLVTELYRTRSIALRRAPELDLQSEPGEEEGAFHQRMHLALAERRDRELAKLRQRHAAELEKLDRRLATAQERHAREEAQLRGRKLSTVVSAGTSVLGALLGRKKLSVTNLNRVGRTVRDFGGTQKEAGDVARAAEKLEDLLQEKQRLEETLRAELEALQASLPTIDQVKVETIEIRPLKGSLAVERLALVWTPWAVDATGIATPLFALKT